MVKQIGQQMIIGLSGPTLTKDEANFIIENNIGGVILFDRNIQNPQQLHELCTQIQSLRHKMQDKAPLFISIDMEGGRVMRLKAPFTKWPPLRKLGDLDSPSATFQFAFMMGREMKAMGINLDYAPCVDIFTNPKNTVIGDRAVGTTPEIVGKHASALVRGYVKSEIIACAKHFPGHGNTIIDSHDDLPVEDADLARLEKVELEPFKKAFRSRLDLVMTAHIRFSKLDNEWPVTLSEKILKELLRGSLRYRGLIISDDLDMKAMTKYYDREMIPVRALQAGCNILLYCNEPASPPIGIDAITKAVAEGTVSKKTIEENYRMVLDLKKNKIPNPDPLPLAEASKIVGHPDHQRLVAGILEGKIPEDLLET